VDFLIHLHSSDQSIMGRQTTC